MVQSKFTGKPFDSKLHGFIGAIKKYNYLNNNGTINSGLGPVER